MRQERPIFYDEHINCWQLFRYEDILRVITDYHTFSSDRKRVFAKDQAAIHSSPVSNDPPRHRQVRDIVNHAFTVRMVEQLVPQITEITNELLNKVIPTGEIDIIKDLAHPLPAIVMADLLGIPEDARERLKQWTEILIARDYHDTVDYLKTQSLSDSQVDIPHALSIRPIKDAMQGMQEVDAYLMRLLEERKRQPHNDLISRLLTTEVGGQRLTDTELIGFCVFLLIASNQITAHLIGNAMHCFIEHPAIQKRLRQQPSLMRDAIEEVLRYHPPVKSMIRIATTDTNIGEYGIQKDQVLILWLASANHDEQFFQNPECFDIQREPNQHIAFGHNIHYCLGAPLARLEARIALNTILAQLPDIRRKGDKPLEPIWSGTVFGVKSLPITWGG